MKGTITFLIALLLHMAAQAQSYKWVHGGGSTDYLSNGIVDAEFVKFICTDDNKNVYILAHVGRNSIKVDTFNKSAVEPNINWNIVFASYDCNGKTRFVKLIESKQTNFAYGLTYSKGKIHVAGNLGGLGKRIGNDAVFSSEYPGAFIAKYDTSGLYQWARFAGADEFSTWNAVGGIDAPIAVDGSGNLHYFVNTKKGVKLTPTLTSQAATYDLKYDVNGNLLGVNMLQQPDSDYYAYRAAIDPATDRAYLIFKRESSNMSKTMAFLAAFQANGNLIWKDTVKDGGLSAFRLGADGIYVTGGGTGKNNFTFGGLSTINQHYQTGGYTCVVKMDYNGNSIWMHTVSGNLGTMGYADLELLPNNQIAALGVFNGRARIGNDSLVSPPGADVHPLLVIIDTGRTLMSMQMIPNTGSSGGYVITKDKYGSMYLGGRVGATITPPGITGYTSNGGNSDFYLIKYGYDCNCTAMPTSAFSYAIDNVFTGIVKFYYNGHKPADSVVWDFGDYTGKVKIDSPVHTYAQAGNFRACATVYTPCGTHRVCKWIKAGVGESVEELSRSNIKIYPNPAQVQLTVEGIIPNTTIQLMDMMGRVVYRGIATHSKEVINTAGIIPGSYILHLTAQDGSRESFRIEKTP